MFVQADSPEEAHVPQAGTSVASPESEGFTPVNATAGLRGRNLQTLQIRRCAGSACSYSRQCCSNMCSNRYCQRGNSGYECCTRNTGTWSWLPTGQTNTDCPPYKHCVYQGNNKWVGIHFGTYSSEQLPSDGTCSY
jgi:hypothetical protein